MDYSYLYAQENFLRKCGKGLSTPLTFRHSTNTTLCKITF